MLWFVATVILGFMCLGFTVSFIKFLDPVEGITAVVLYIAMYWTAVQGGIIQPVV